MVRFGVAGYPPAFFKTPEGKNRSRIFYWLANLGLNALELQMTYGPKTTPDTCKEYAELASDFGISLSIHASYFIVFTSADAKKINNSEETLKRTFELAHILGSRIIVLHPGPLYNSDPIEALNRFIENLSHCLSDIGESDIGLFVETAGKIGQLGSVDEILNISAQISNVFPCIDFGHVHARTLGTLETNESIHELFQKLESHGHLKSPSRVHLHYTPIHYGPRGEISHKAINDRYPCTTQMVLPVMNRKSLQSDDGLFHPRFEAIGKALSHFNVDCNVISETNDSQEEGALALKNAFLLASEQ
jgi:deoxyribonuclease IV